jgi:hypothetical protein
MFIFQSGLGGRFADCAATEMLTALQWQRKRNLGMIREDAGYSLAVCIDPGRFGRAKGRGNSQCENGDS